jgi:hypothetical protein
LRGHIYEQYAESRWRETPFGLDAREVATTPDRTVLMSEGRLPTSLYSMTPRFRTDASRRGRGGSRERPSDTRDTFAQQPNLNAANCQGNDCQLVAETIEPVQSVSSAIVASGFPVAVQGDLGVLLVRPNAVAAIQQSSLYSNTYSVRSRVNLASASIQEKAAGLIASQKQQWQRDPRTAATLALQSDFEQRIQLQHIADGILLRAKNAGIAVDTPGRKARAVKNYLTLRCRYSLQSPAVPQNQDAVLYFLQQSKVGTCDMFASSAALLLRAMGVPTRLASGYIQPENVEPGSAYTVRERDAHAWIEYYVPSLGWLPSDPTEGVRTVEEEETAFDVLLSKHDRLKAFILSLPILALMMFGLVAVRTRRTRKPPIVQAQTAPADLNVTRIRRHYLRALQLMRRRIPRAPGATPEEYENAVMRSRLPDEAKIEFSALTYLFTHSQFSASCAQSDEVEMHASLSRLRRALRRAPK